MTVALIISGRFTAWQDCYESIMKNLIEVHKPTIFASLHGEGYGDPGVKAFADAYGLPLSPDRLRVSKMSPPNPSHPVWKKYKPPQSIWAPYRFGSMFYHHQQAGQMVDDYATKNHVTFDFVIRFRPDIICHEPYPIPNKESMLDDVIYIPKSLQHYHEYPNWIHDQHCVISMNTMRKLNQIFNNLESFFDKYGIDLVCPEVAFFNHASKLGVTRQWAGVFAFDITTKRHLDDDTHEGSRKCDPKAAPTA